MLRRARAFAITALAGLLGATTVAYAQEGRLKNGFDGDIDLFRPNFGIEGTLPGIDVARNWRGGSARWGLNLMYSNSPLVLYKFDQEVGSVINNRVSAYLGASVDITRAFTVRMTVPAYFQFGTNVPQLASEGFALGDIGVGGHGIFFNKPNVSLGLRADLFLPTSRHNFYAGERMPHIQGALLTTFDVGRVRIASDLGVDGRFKLIDTKDDLKLGTELMWDAGVRVNVLREKLDIGASIYSRFGFTHFFGAGESSGEAMLTASYHAMPFLVVDVGAGRGFTKGYGSTDVRAFAQLKFQKRHKEVGEDGAELTDEDKVVACVHAYDKCMADGIDPMVCKAQLDQCKDVIFHVRTGGTTITAPPDAPLTDEQEWADPKQVVRVTSDGQQLEIRFAIEFEKDTNIIRPDSLPVVDAIAEFLNNDARIAHLVIEGHASPDGDDAVNYPLSQSRAGSIWERLVTVGVVPSRLSYRGMGEVMPILGPDGEPDPVKSRRVVFHIVRQYDLAYETPPKFKIELRYPWDGQPYTAVQPRVPSADEASGLDQIMQRRDVKEEPDTLQGVQFDKPEDEEDTIPLDDGSTPPPDAPPAQTPAEEPK